MNDAAARIGSSFRNPSGFIFTRDGVLFHQVQERYRPHFERLIGSGLYAALTAEGLLIPHEDCPLSEAAAPGAALLTLRVQTLALAHGTTLKDASAFNVQFRGVRPVLIDTLSFECNVDGAPWVAYRQFCQHFLAPLALESMVDVRLGGLHRQHLDGVPLDLASTLLPRRSWLSPAMLMHVHMHARSIARHAPTDATALREAAAVQRAKVTKRGLEGVIAHLQSAIEGLDWHPAGTEWGHYEETHNYDTAGRTSKQGLVAEFVRASGAKRVLDLGANAGEYSRVALSAGAELVVAADGDPVAVERGFRRLSEGQETGIYPLLVDLTNPSAAQGWDHAEWPSLAGRGPFDAVLVLALIHHLAIGNNVPLDGVAAMLARLGTTVIVEWVPKSDPQVQRLLRAREDIFDHYTDHELRAAFARLGMREEQSAPVGDSGRVLHRFVR